MPNREQDENKTAGDVNDGRMAPGKEGRGGHRVQRRPMIEGEVEGELKKLQKKAETVTEFLGHVPQVWRADPDNGVVIFRCSACELTSGIALNPMCDYEKDPDRKGKVIAVPRDQINGVLFEARCDPDA